MLRLPVGYLRYLIALVSQGFYNVNFLGALDGLGASEFSLQGFRVLQPWLGSSTKDDFQDKPRYENHRGALSTSSHSA